MRIKHESQRSSNIELLRIVCMLLIISHHLASYGGVDIHGTNLTFKMLWCQFLYMGKVGVNIFVIISGYFLSETNELKIRKIIKTYIKLWLYSMLLFSGCILCGQESFSFVKAFKHFFPLTYNEWWFMSSYFPLLLLSPFFNIIVMQLNKKSYIVMLSILIILFSVITSILPVSWENNNLIWFSALYFVGAFIRKFRIDEHKPRLPAGCKAFIVAALTFFVCVILDFASNKITALAKYSTYLFGMNKIPMLLLSVFIFIAFVRAKIESNLLINTVASNVFGIYLIHDNEHVRFLWRIILNEQHISKDFIFALYSVLLVFLVFAFCCLLDRVLEFGILRWLYKFADTASDVVYHTAERLLAPFGDKPD